MQKDKQEDQMTTEEPQPPEEKPKKSVRREIFEWVRALGIAALASIFLMQVVIINAHIPSSSMEPTIYPKDRVIGFRLAYVFSEVERGDIIIFPFPDDESQLFVKRVIGMPGDTVRVIDGYVYLNGSPERLEEPYIRPQNYNQDETFIVPEGHYFVLGDNRGNSRDSREWDNTFVAEEDIIAKGVFRLFPWPGLLN